MSLFTSILIGYAIGVGICYLGIIFLPKIINNAENLITLKFATLFVGINFAFLIFRTHEVFYSIGYIFGSLIIAFLAAGIKKNFKNVVGVELNYAIFTISCVFIIISISKL